MPRFAKRFGGTHRIVIGGAHVRSRWWCPRQRSAIDTAEPARTSGRNWRGRSIRISALPRARAFATCLKNVPPSTEALDRRPHDGQQCFVSLLGPTTHALVPREFHRQWQQPSRICGRTSWHLTTLVFIAQRRLRQDARQHASRRFWRTPTWLCQLSVPCWVRRAAKCRRMRLPESQRIWHRTRMHGVISLSQDEAQQRHLRSWPACASREGCATGCGGVTTTATA